MYHGLDEVKRALIVGDTHGSRGHIRNCCEAAVRYGCDALFVAGDFGCWPRRLSAFVPKAEKKVRLNWTKNLTDYPIKIYFVDGNHEDHGYLGPLSLKGPVTQIMHPWTQEPLDIFYVRRATCLTIQNTKCLFIGGAFSIDWYERVDGFDWFRYYECVSYDDMYMSMDHGKVDFVLAHDCPLGVNIPTNKTSIESDQNREKLQRVFDVCKPQWWFFGHYHRFFQSFHHSTNTLFQCLPADCNDDDRRGMIFDFERGDIEEPYPVTVEPKKKP